MTTFRSNAMDSNLTTYPTQRDRDRPGRAAATSAARPLATRPRLRKAALVLHIVSGIGWMGADIVLFILLITGLTTDDGALAAACYRAVAVFVPLAVPALSLTMLATGLLLGWGTKWGILRHWWVVVKLALAVVMVVLVFVSLLPGVNDLTNADTTMSASAVRDGLGSAPEQMLYPPVVSFLMLATAAVLSVYKPWRQTPWSGARRTAREPARFQ
jgi:hypothetical protein